MHVGASSVWNFPEKSEISEIGLSEIGGIMEVETKWTLTSDPVDISKLSPETRVKLIVFADVAGHYHLSKRIIWTNMSGPVFSVVYPDQIAKDYFNAWENLKSIPEEQVRWFVDNADSAAKIDEFQQRRADQNREPQNYEFTRIWDEAQNFERELIALGDRIIHDSQK
jgi:hypothetical protein